MRLKPCSKGHCSRYTASQRSERGNISSPGGGTPGRRSGIFTYLTLALVCTTFRDIVSTVSFRRRAHFQWLDSVATWSRFSVSYRQEFYVMYNIGTCCGCRQLYKNNTPGYVGTGKRGVLQGIYSEDPYPGYCSQFCSQMQ
ncbi:uncharacterized protein LOC144988819 [Oryzias latipes]